MIFFYVTIALLFFQQPAFGQIYSSYTRSGKSNNAGGIISYKVLIEFNKDGSFSRESTWVKKRANGNPIIESDISHGQWKAKGDTLLLDFNAEMTDAQKKNDVYLIKGKKLKRMTFENEKTLFKASGELL